MTIFLGGIIMVVGVKRQGGGRRYRLEQPPQNQDQAQDQPRRKSFDLGKYLALGMKIMVFLMLLMCAVNLGSCTWKTLNWGLGAVKGSHEFMQQTMLGDPVERTEEDKLLKVERDREAARKEQGKKIEPIQESVKHWLNSAFARHEGWEDVNAKLQVSSDGTKKTCVFSVMPNAGKHMLPVELALAPVGTSFHLEDENGLSSGRHSLAINLGNKVYVIGGYVRPISIVEDCVYSPSLLLKIRYPPIKTRRCLFTVYFADAAAAQLDENTRLCLEKSFWALDDRPVKVMDLPTVIDGVPVSWDLVVRCYPVPVSDTGSDGGRWMPSFSLSRLYLSLDSPSLQIRESEDPGDPVIWEDDDEPLLRDGVFSTSTEEMRERVQEWRCLKGKFSEEKWKGGNRLYIKVREIPNRNNEEDNAIGVLVRVILRVRTWTRG